MWEYLAKHPTLPVLLVSAVLAILSLRIQRRLARSKNSIDLQNNYLASERMHELMVQVAKVAREKDAKWLAELAAIKKQEGEDKEKIDAINNIRIVLNSFERMAIGVGSKVYDEKLLFRSYRGFVTETYEKLYPYIKEKQEGGRYYNNFCDLAIKWSELSKDDQEPVYFWSVKSFFRGLVKLWRNWLKK